MNHSVWPLNTKAAFRTLLLGCAVALVAISCKYMPWSKAASKQQTCISDPSSIKSQDFGVPMEVESRLKASLLATAAMTQLAQKLDKETADACGALVSGLGGSKASAKGKPKSDRHARAACSEAAEKLKSMRQKVANALTVETEPPRCALPVSSYARCARDCDPNLGSDNSAVVCEEGAESGNCAGKCMGKCYTDFGDCEGLCYGSCEGGCDQGFVGKCDGKCDGICDGKGIKMKVCEGKCEGQCTKDASGTCSGVCKGECAGTCMMAMPEKGGKCGNGTCVGSCDQALSRVECGAVLFPPEIGMECLSQCRAQGVAMMRCKPALVKAEVYGNLEPKVAARLTSVIPQKLPDLLEVHEGMRSEVESTSEALEDLFDGVHEAMDEDPSVRTKIQSCVGAAEKSLKQSRSALERTLEAAQEAVAAVTE
jgi:hypothetical protein